MKNFWEWFLTEATNLRFYHGTTIDRVPSIIQHGLKADAAHRYAAPQFIQIAKQTMRFTPPTARQDKTVYFTRNKQQAARYGVGGNRKDIPAIIEFVISGPRRFKGVQYDPMDRAQNAWGDDLDFSEPETDEAALRALQQGVEKLYRKYTGQRLSGEIYNTSRINDQGLSALDGFNLYGTVLGLLRSVMGDRYRHYQQQIKQDLPRAFNNKTFRTMFQVTPSGTLRVRNAYFKSKDQFRWHRDVVPQQIKAVWVRQDDFPTLKGKGKKFGEQEVTTWYKDRLDIARDVYGEIYNRIENLINDPEDAKDEIEEWLKRLKTTEFDDLIDELNGFLDALEEPDEEDLQARAEELKDLAQEAEHSILSRYGETEVKNVTRWIRLEVSSPEIKSFFPQQP